MRIRTAECEIVDMAAVDYNTDVVHMERHRIWRAYAQWDAIPADRQLTICDAISGAQWVCHGQVDVHHIQLAKGAGGEARGMLILSPRAVERLETYTPAWPLPKIFRLTKGGKLIEVFSLAKQLIRHPCWPLRITSQHWIGLRMLMS